MAEMQIEPLGTDLPACQGWGESNQGHHNSEHKSLLILIST